MVCGELARRRNTIIRGMRGKCRECSRRIAISELSREKRERTGTPVLIIYILDYSALRPVTLKQQCFKYEKKSYLSI